MTAPPALCSSDEEDPNKIGGSTFIVNASPAVVPLKTTLPSQMRLKPHLRQYYYSGENDLKTVIP